MEQNIDQLVSQAMIDSKKYGESQDCLIRAVVTMTGMSYDDAHAVGELAGRPHGKGWYMFKVVAVLEELGYKFKRHYMRRTSAGVFARTHKGNFLVARRSHAFNIIDGRVYNEPSSRVFLVLVYEYLGKE